jgi:hypothetical protein
LASLGLIVSDVHFLPDAHGVVVRHDDGRTYLLDVDWLSQIVTAKTPVRHLVDDIRNKHAGPAATPWWDAEHPPHHPWAEAKASVKRERGPID